MSEPSLAADVGREVLATLIGVALLSILGFLGLGGSLLDVYQWSLRLQIADPAEHTAIVTVDEQTLRIWNSLDPTPEVTPRALLAQLVRTVNQAGAKVVVLDFEMPEATSGDAELAAAARAHGNVIVAERYVPSTVPGEPAFLQATTAAIDTAVRPGLANFSLQASTFFSDVLLARKVPLGVLVHRAHYRGRWPHSLIGPGTGETLTMPSLALLAAAAHRGVDPGVFLDDVVLDRDSISIPYRGRAGADGIPVVTGGRLLQVMGQQELVASLGGGTGGAIPADLVAVFSDRVVLLCRASSQGSDRFATPLNLPLPNRPDMSGCVIHAHLVEGFLSGDLVRLRGRFLCWLAVPLLVWTVLRSSRRWTLERVILVWSGGVVATGLVATLIFHFTGGLALALGPALLAVMVTVFALAIQGKQR